MLPRNATGIHQDCSIGKRAYYNQLHAPTMCVSAARSVGKVQCKQFSDAYTADLADAIR